VTGFDVVQRSAAHQWREDGIALAKRAVAGRTGCIPYVRTLVDGAAALGQSLEIRPHINIPCLELCLGRGSANIVRLGGIVSESGGTEHSAQRARQQSALSPSEH